MNNEIYKIYQIIEFFVKDHDYATLYAKKYAKSNEIWLFNYENPHYQLIRISTFSLGETSNDIERIDTIINEIGTQNKNDKLVMLDVHISNETVVGDEIFDTICLNLNYFDGVDLDVIFPGIKNVLHPIDNLESELKRSLLSINDSLKEKQKFLTKKNFIKKFVSKENMATLIISFICIVMYIITAIMSNSYNNSSVLVYLGADYKIFTLGLNEYWRLFTSALLHGSLLHLVCNLFSFIYIGTAVEGLLGKVKYIIMLVAGIVIGSLTHGVLSTNNLSVGLSGGIYCIFTYFVMYYLANKRLSFQALLPTIILNLYLNFLSSVAWQAHLGGAICGVLFYYIYKDNKVDIKLSLAVLVLIGGLFYKYYTDYAITPYYGATDNEVIQIYQDKGFNKHALNIEQKLYKIYTSEE